MSEEERGHSVLTVIIVAALVVFGLRSGMIKVNTPNIPRIPKLPEIPKLPSVETTPTPRPSYLAFIIEEVQGKTDFIIEEVAVICTGSAGEYLELPLPGGTRLRLDDNPHLASQTFRATWVGTLTWEVDPNNPSNIWLEGTAEAGSTLVYQSYHVPRLGFIDGWPYEQRATKLRISKIPGFSSFNSLKLFPNLGNEARALAVYLVRREAHLYEELSTYGPFDLNNQGEKTPFPIHNYENGPGWEQTLAEARRVVHLVWYGGTTRQVTLEDGTEAGGVTVPPLREITAQQTAQFLCGVAGAFPEAQVTKVRIILPKDDNWDYKPDTPGQYDSWEFQCTNYGGEP